MYIYIYIYTHVCIYIYTYNLFICFYFQHIIKTRVRLQFVKGTDLKTHFVAGKNRTAFFSRLQGNCCKAGRKL